MHSVRFSMRCSFLAGTALALILAVSATASAAPQNAEACPGAATGRARLQHAGQHAQAVVDDGRRHPLPRLAAGIGRRRIAAAHATPLRPPPAATRREQPAKPRQPHKPVHRARRPGARAGRRGEPVAKAAPRAGSAVQPVTRRRARAQPVAAPASCRCAAPERGAVRPPLLPRRTPRARPTSATSFARSSPASSSTAWSRASPTATRSSRSTRRAAASSRCGCRRARRASAPRT